MMNNIRQSLQTLLDECNAHYAVLVDSTSGMILGHVQSPSNTRLDLELLAAGTTEIVRSDTNTARFLGIDPSEEILFTQTRDFHVIHMAVNYPGLYIVAGMDKQRGNLALLRRKVSDIDQQLRL